MKAESAILTGAHLPMTWFGLPPTMFIVTVAASAVSLGMTIALGFMPISLPLAAVVFIILWTVFYRLNRHDHHSAKLMFIAPRIWRGRQSRALIAGTPPDVKLKKGIK